MPKPVVPTSISVDFSKVEDRREGGKAAHVPEGDYLLRVESCEKKAKKDDDTSYYLSWRTSIIKPEKFKGAGSVWHTTSLKEEALWNLRNFLEDLGIKVPKSTVKVPVAEIVAKHMVFGATLADDEYNGKIKSKIAGTFKKSEYEESDDEDSEDDDEETEEAPPAPKKVKKSTETVPEAAATADEEDEDEDLEELDVDDL